MNVPSAPVVPDDAPLVDRWIDVNLTQQVVVAYEGRSLARMAPASTGPHRHGMALHENYWKALDEFGIPSSYGCAGLRAADAQFLWDWATVGTPILVHA